MAQWIRRWTLNHEALGSNTLAAAVVSLGEAITLIAESPGEEGTQGDRTIGSLLTSSSFPSLCPWEIVKSQYRLNSNTVDTLAAAVVSLGESHC